MFTWDTYMYPVLPNPTNQLNLEFLIPQSTIIIIETTHPLQDQSISNIQN
jgi:hypothetical protein